MKVNALNGIDIDFLKKAAALETAITELLPENDSVVGQWLDTSVEAAREFAWMVSEYKRLVALRANFELLSDIEEDFYSDAMNGGNRELEAASNDFNDHVAGCDQCFALQVATWNKHCATGADLEKKMKYMKKRTYMLFSGRVVK